MVTTQHRIYATSFASVYPHYVAKAEKKGRTKAEVDEIIRWLTGHSQETLDDELAGTTSFEDFFARALRRRRHVRNALGGAGQRRQVQQQPDPGRERHDDRHGEESGEEP